MELLTAVTLTVVIAGGISALLFTISLSLGRSLDRGKTFRAVHLAAGDLSRQLEMAQAISIGAGKMTIWFGEEEPIDYELTNAGVRRSGKRWFVSGATVTDLDLPRTDAETSLRNGQVVCFELAAVFRSQIHRVRRCVMLVGIRPSDLTGGF